MWENGPNVSVKANAADSHYEPTGGSKPIRSGDFVLIDIWGAREARRELLLRHYVDGRGGPRADGARAEVFETVRDARDAAIQTVKRRLRRGVPIAGWEADDAAREVIRAAGLGDYFTHRTGHNIATMLHGNGAHLDNLETHDERLILPNTCFSVEPGVYLPGEFGVRSEVNMMTRPGRLR